MFAGCCELGINVFEPYRGVEMRAMYSQLLRALHHVLGVDYYFMTPYGMGEGNDEAIRSGAGSGDFRTAPGILFRQIDLYDVRRQQFGSPVRPFDEDDAAGRGLIETKLLNLLRRGNPIKVEMRDGKARLVCLHDRKCGARYFQSGIRGK